MAKIRLEDIQVEAEERGWKVVSTEYKNLDAQMIFQCPEGHKVYNSWKKIRTKWTCPLCEQNQYQVKDDRTVPKKKGITRVLGLDQSTKKSGWSVFDNMSLVKHGLFETTLPDEITRDIEVRMWLISMINAWKPDVVAIEGIQYQQEKGVKTFAILARLQGILMATCAEMGVEYIICPTNSWKSYCGVKGRTRADQKRSMQFLVKDWYDISVINDESDAIGIGKYAANKKQNVVEMIRWE